MPPPFEKGRLGLENTIWLSEPVALTSIASAVPEHEVEVLDMRLEPEDALAHALRRFKPDLVGTTSMTTDAYQAKAVLRMTRQIRPEALTVVGGHHPTLSPEEFDEPFVDVIVQGEGEDTFKELVAAWSRQLRGNDRAFPGLNGTRFVGADGKRVGNAKRSQVKSLDALPMPNRKLIKKYQGRYFFASAHPMASIFTSRGCSFDCNFCAIWEFYERRTRFLSAKCIVDQMLACDEPFVFLLDDNFLTDKKRLVDLCDELERRDVKKYWLTQGRTDFIADNPDLIARLAKNGLVMLLSGFESNDDDALASLRKKNSWEKNKRANQIMRENGIFSTGIFMVRPDWTAEQFDQLYEYINTLEIGIPLVTILTPLPGTQLYKAYKDQLVTTDHRLFDLLHSVLPTRLPRDEFYRHFARALDATSPSGFKALKAFVKNRRWMVLRHFRNVPWFFARAMRYQRIHRDPLTFLRDEEGLLNGPGAKLTWNEVSYPGDENAAPNVVKLQGRPRVPKLNIPTTMWVDNLPKTQEAAS
jgi:radical SAM superfamily enzyme YgiQ (UPF0313 family)